MYHIPITLARTPRVPADQSVQYQVPGSPQKNISQSWHFELISRYWQVDDMDGTKRTVLTDTSNKPTGRDANFLQVNTPTEV